MRSNAIEGESTAVGNSSTKERFTGIVMRCSMNEKCFQIISGIVYPHIEFVARRYSAQRFGLSGHSRAPGGIRRRKHVIIRAIAQSQLVPTLEIQRTRSRPKSWPNTVFDALHKRATNIQYAGRPRFFSIAQRGRHEFLQFVAQKWLSSWWGCSFVPRTKMRFNEHLTK